MPDETPEHIEVTPRATLTRYLIVEVEAPVDQGGVADFHLADSLDQIQEMMLLGATYGSHLRPIQETEYEPRDYTTGEQTYKVTERKQLVRWKTGIKGEPNPAQGEI